MKHLAAITLLLLSFSARAEFTIAGGFDIAFDQGRPYAELRYFGEKYRFWNAYVATDSGIGAEVYYTFEGLNGDIQFGWGLEYGVANPDIVDTNLAYDLRFEYYPSQLKDWSFGLKHRSNCKTVCDNELLKWARIGDDDSENHGYNFLFARWSF